MGTMYGGCCVSMSLFLSNSFSQKSSPNIHIHEPNSCQRRHDQQDGYQLFLRHLHILFHITLFFIYFIENSPTKGKWSDRSLCTTLMDMGFQCAS